MERVRQEDRKFAKFRRLCFFVVVEVAERYWKSLETFFSVLGFMMEMRLQMRLGESHNAAFSICWKLLAKPSKT